MSALVTVSAIVAAVVLALVGAPVAGTARELADRLLRPAKALARVA